MVYSLSLLFCLLGYKSSKHLFDKSMWGRMNMYVSGDITVTLIFLFKDQR